MTKKCLCEVVSHHRVVFRHIADVINDRFHCTQHHEHGWWCCHSGNVMGNHFLCIADLCVWHLKAGGGDLLMVRHWQHQRSMHERDLCKCQAIWRLKYRHVCLWHIAMYCWSTCVWEMRRRAEYYHGKNTWVVVAWSVHIHCVVTIITWYHNYLAEMLLMNRRETPPAQMLCTFCFLLQNFFYFFFLSINIHYGIQYFSKTFA